MHFLNTFFFDIYPYIAGSVFLIGSWLRYDYGQYAARGVQSDAGSQRDERRQTCFISGSRAFCRALSGHVDAALDVRSVATA